MRKIIQILEGKHLDNYKPMLGLYADWFALCDDGTLWVLDQDRQNPHWKRVDRFPEIPEAEG